MIVNDKDIVTLEKCIDNNCIVETIEGNDHYIYRCIVKKIDVEGGWLIIDQKTGPGSIKIESIIDIKIIPFYEFKRM